MLLNVRGCALYLPNQYTELSIVKLFASGKPGVITELKLQPENLPEVNLVEVSARFLRFTGNEPEVGMVLRFVNLSESQMDAINNLVELLPPVKAA